MSDRTPLMGDPFERQTLSKTSIFLLGVLAGVNLLIAGYFLFWRADQTPATPQRVETIEGPELRLLSELDESERAALEREEITPGGRRLPQQLIEEVPPATVCRSWGPFPDRASLDPLVAEIAEVGEVIEIRSGEIQSTPDYLVYLESDNNPDNARRLLQDLESQSIDAYVIAGGEFVNSVSAGVFSTENRAARQIRILTDLGYTPKIEALERAQTVHHLIAEVPEEFEIEGRESDDCQTIASAQ